MDDDPIIIGAGNIAKVRYGSDEPRYRRRIYHLVRTGQLRGVFKEGADLAARKSVLLKHTEELEDKGWHNGKGEGQREEREIAPAAPKRPRGRPRKNPAAA